jgi:hypothetical protein
MAYDPKSFLDQALKTGFQSIVAGPSGEGDPGGQVLDTVAEFSGVQVRPLVYGGTEDAPENGYMVSAPLSGKYEGYHRNDIYDNNGKFVRTAISEPQKTSGLTDLAKFAVNAASFGGFGPIATAAANAYKGVQAAKSGDWLSAAASILPGVGVIPGVDKGLADTLKTVGGYAKTGSAIQKAIENKDILALLESTSGIPGAPRVPTELTDVLKGVGQASRIREAVKNDNFQGLFNEIVGASKAGGKSGKGYFPGYETPGEIQEGFFDVGGPGYMEPDAGDLPDWELDPYRPTIDVTATATADDWYQEGATPTYSGVPEWDDALDIVLQTGKAPGELNQTIDVAGTLPTTGVIIPDWDVMEELDRTPGTLLDTPSNEDRTVATTGTTDTTGTTGTTRTTGGGGGGGGGSSTKPASSGPNLDALMKALMLMQQRPEDKKEQYQLANMPDYEDLMYGLSSGETPYMRG